MTSHRATAAFGMAFAAMLALSACAASEPSDAAATPAATRTSASASAPTPEPSSSKATKPKAKGTVEGNWCPTKESPEDRCLTVELPEVTYDDGSSFTIDDGLTFKEPGGSVQYSFEGAPFGSFYPAGTDIDIPDYYSGDDKPDQDRIWNAQTGVLLLRETAGQSGDTTSGDDFAAELEDTWRSKDGSETFSMDGLREDNPEAFVSSTVDSDDVPGATDISICLAANGGAGECTTSASMFLRYLPAGTSWDCAEAGKEGKLPGGFTSCDPDFTDEHDPSKPRLIRLPNHQHDKQYVDSVPMYKAD